MNVKQVNAILAEQLLPPIQPDYNYTIFSIRTKQPDNVAGLLRGAKLQLIKRFNLLPYICYVRKQSVVIPLPIGTELNIFSKAIEPILAPMPVKIPSWS